VTIATSPTANATARPASRSPPLRVEAFDYARHAPLLASWLSHQFPGVDAGSARLYPQTGFVVDDVAAGFLYRTDAPGVAYLDGFVADMRESPRRRAAAFIAIAARLVEEADRLGIDLLFAFPSVEALVRMGEPHGFVVFGGPHTCITRIAPRLRPTTTSVAARDERGS
jgi:hypothetical protein